MLPDLTNKSLQKFPGCLLTGCFTVGLLVLSPVVIPIWVIIWLAQEAQKRSEKNLVDAYARAKTTDPNLTFQEFATHLRQK
jgi:uncharacterized membrane protein